MKHWMRAWAMAGLIFWGGAARAAEDDGQAYLAVLAETQVQVMPGMPKIELPPGFDVSQLPASMRAMLGGQPDRRLEVRLWSDGIQPAESWAKLNVPAGLGQGPTLDLELYRPKPDQTESEAEPASLQQMEGQMAKMTIKRYWGSSPTVRPNQPVVWSWDNLSPEFQRALAESASRSAAAAGEGGGSYFYRPNWTTGFWPTEAQPGDLEPTSALPGHYALESNYLEAATIDVPDTVDFLGAFELTNPDLSQSPDLAAAVALRWKPIANLLGAQATIIGMEGQDTLIIWSSSESDDDQSGYSDFLPMAEVREKVANQVFMGPDQQEAIVPAGIFKNCGMVMLNMQGWGTGTANDTSTPRIRVQTRTSLMSFLNASMMAGMGGG